MKLCKVVPVFKNKGSNQNLNNYRPIALLSNIDKIFEKLVHKRMTSFLDKHEIISNHQFGFRKKHSTSLSLITLTEKIRKDLDEGKFSCGVFIDLQKAFDTVDHNILLRKLEHYGIRGITNKWFESYLSNRKQYVYYSETKSNISTVEHGVPQGSVLGPLLFTLYINDINNALLFSCASLFADDTSILFSDFSLKRIEKCINIDLKRLFKWLCANKISLNVSKTEVVLFRGNHKNINYNIGLKLNGKKLTLSESVKYLGVILDQSLSWNPHINNLSTKLKNANGIISKVRHVLPISVLLSIYNALFSSHLTYACQCWCQNINTKSDRILKLQKRCVRLLTFSKYDTPSSPLFHFLNILKINDQVKLLNTTLVHDILTNSLPMILINTFSLKYYPDCYETRRKTKGLLCIPRFKTTKYGLNSIIYQSINHWNELQLHYDKYLLYVNRTKFKKLCFENLIKTYV